MHSPSHFTAPTNLIFNYSLTLIDQVGKQEEKESAGRGFYTNISTGILRKKGQRKQQGKCQLSAHKVR